MCLREWAPLELLGAAATRGILALYEILEFLWRMWVVGQVASFQCPAPESVNPLKLKGTGGRAFEAPPSPTRIG